MKKKTWVPFAAVLAVLWLAMLLLNLLTPMLADDYRYAFSFATGERLRTVWDIFPSLAAHAQVLNGRLVPHFFVQLFTLLPHAVFSALNSFLYLALLLGAYRLIRPTETKWDWQRLLMVAGAVFLLPPAFGQSFLWMSGSLNYLWCDALMVWLFVPFADNVLREREPSPAVRFALLPVGALLLGNMSENVSAAAALMMGLCTGWVWLRRRRLSVWMALATVLTVVGWLLLMLAPANRGNLAKTGLDFTALFTQFHNVLTIWMQNGLWPSVAFMGVFFAAVAKRGDPNRLFVAMALFACSFLCNLAMLASPYYPERAFTGSQLLTVLAIGMALYALPEGLWRRALIHTLAGALTLVMAFQLCYAIPSAYNRYQLAQARVAEVCAERDAGQTDITTYGINGNTRFDAFYQLNELTESATYFPNVAFAKYYRLNSIVVDRYE
ncbi:MAG TPA: DUF6056 family protein [Candidatus Limiplasma sp.]|nr:DUF6056 family protein [Candidatus Limiplasma sp.]HPS81446.1 DUF6056 family protein [Candidatus Limiplasma sp.]